MTIKWVDAPPAPRPGRPTAAKQPKWAKEARQFRKHPGQWGILTTNASPALAFQLTHGQVAAFRDGRWEAVARTAGHPNGRATIYTRYLGETYDDE